MESEDKEMQNLKLHSNQSISTGDVVTRRKIYARKNRNELLKNVLELRVEKTFGKP